MDKAQVIASVSRSEMELRGLGALSHSIIAPRRFLFDALEIVVSEQRDAPVASVYFGQVRVVFTRCDGQHEWLLPSIVDAASGELFLQFYDYFPECDPSHVLRAVWCLYRALDLDVLVLADDGLSFDDRTGQALTRERVWFGCCRDVAWAAGFDSVLTTAPGALFL